MSLLVFMVRNSKVWMDLDGSGMDLHHDMEDHIRFITSVRRRERRWRREEILSYLDWMLGFELST